MDLKKLLMLNEDVALSINSQKGGPDDKAPKNYGEYISTQVKSMIQQKADFTKANDKELQQMGKNMATVAKSKFKNLEGLPKNDVEANNMLQSEIQKQTMDADGDGKETDESIEAEKQIDDLTKKISEKTIRGLSPKALKMILNESFNNIDDTINYDTIFEKAKKSFNQFVNKGFEQLTEENAEVLKKLLDNNFKDMDISFEINLEGNDFVDKAYHNPKNDHITVFLSYGYWGINLGEADFDPDYDDIEYEYNYEKYLDAITTTIIHELTHRYQNSKFKNRSKRDLYDPDAEHFDINEWKKSKDEIGAQAVEYANIFNHNDNIQVGIYGDPIFHRFMLYQHEPKLRNTLIKKIYPLLNDRGKKSFTNFIEDYYNYCKEHPQGEEY